MRRIGFSTGALALGDVDRGLEMLRGRRVEVVELSALRQPELQPLVSALGRLELGQFEYVAFHAPSCIERRKEAAVVERLRHVADRGWPIVLHPDAVTDWNLWEPFGSLLLVENMDRRKEIGRTVEDLEKVFERVPEAGFCLDVGHAQQCDSSMTEAYRMLKRFGSRLRQIHLSEVSTSSTHDRLSYVSILAVREVAHLIPEDIPVILETPVSANQIEDEIGRARSALSTAIPTESISPAARTALA